MIEAEKHTPGPWTIPSGGEIPWTEGDAATAIENGEPLGDTMILFPILSADETIALAPWEPMAGPERVAELEANARLIAAAPDMLDALRLCADVLDGTRGVGERPSFINIDGARILARAAIAKATGEEAGRVETREESIQRLAAALKEAADA